jgi:pseudouridine-5'-phosphate glycosidase
MLSLAPEVSDALASNTAVVALESTIITHGMAYPTNVETARAVEGVIRERGAVPATIAIIDGSIRVGLADRELDQLAEEGTSATKVSRRDLAHVLQRRLTGGTTVAATMFAAESAGISIFATGGIGGVHRGAEKTFDISADLRELAQTDVTVVCAGIKSILDLGLTLEYLETHGVPVVGFGTEMLPAFYTRESDYSVDHRVDTAAEVAELIRIRRALSIGGGMIVANPIPESASLDRSMIDKAIDQANLDTLAAGVVGKETTPYLLDRVTTLTGSASLAANIELAKNNARVAADIAVAL